MIFLFNWLKFRFHVDFQCSHQYDFLYIEIHVATLKLKTVDGRNDASIDMENLLFFCRVFIINSSGYWFVWSDDQSSLLQSNGWIFTNGREPPEGFVKDKSSVKKPLRTL